MLVAEDPNFYWEEVALVGIPISYLAKKLKSVDVGQLVTLAFLGECVINPFSDLEEPQRLCSMYHLL